MRDKALKAMRDAFDDQFGDTISPLGLRRIAYIALSAYESHLSAEGMAVVPVEDMRRLREALEKISAEQWTDRSTVSELNAWPAFQRLNRHVVELYAIADAALAAHTHTQEKDA